MEDLCDPLQYFEPQRQQQHCRQRPSASLFLASRKKRGIIIKIIIIMLKTEEKTVAVAVGVEARMLLQHVHASLFSYGFCGSPWTLWDFSVLMDAGSAGASHRHRCFIHSIGRRARSKKFINIPGQQKMRDRPTKQQTANRKQKSANQPTHVFTPTKKKAAEERKS